MSTLQGSLSDLARVILLQKAKNSKSSKDSDSDHNETVKLTNTKFSNSAEHICE